MTETSCRQVSLEPRCSRHIASQVEHQQSGSPLDYCDEHDEKSATPAQPTTTCSGCPLPIVRGAKAGNPLGLSMQAKRTTASGPPAREEKCQAQTGESHSTALLHRSGLSLMGNSRSQLGPQRLVAELRCRSSSDVKQSTAEGEHRPSGRPPAGHRYAEKKVLLHRTVFKRGPRLCSHRNAPSLEPRAIRNEYVIRPLATCCGRHCEHSCTTQNPLN